VNDLSIISSLERTVGRFESDKGRRTSARLRLDTEKIVQIGGVARWECFVGDCDNFVVNALINFEPM